MRAMRTGLMTARQLSRERPRHVSQVTSSVVTVDFIESQLRVSRDHLTPELPLHLLTPSCPLYHAPAQAGLPDPWWAIYWPGGQVLARTILDNPSLVRGRRVLDLGSGCGALSLAALASGAGAVTANDIDTNAVTATLVNMKLNNIKEENIDFLTENLLEGQNQNILENIDTLLIGDMFYDEVIGSSVLEICRRFVSISQDKEVLLGDPGRWFWISSEDEVQSLFTCISQHSLPTTTKMENYGFDTGFAWRMRAKPL